MKELYRLLVGKSRGTVVVGFGCLVRVKEVPWSQYDRVAVGSAALLFLAAIVAGDLTKNVRSEAVSSLPAGNK